GSLTTSARSPKRLIAPESGSGPADGRMVAARGTGRLREEMCVEAARLLPAYPDRLLRAAALWTEPSAELAGCRLRCLRAPRARARKVCRPWPRSHQNRR